MSTYTEEQIEKKMLENKEEALYKQPCVNYKGKLKDGKHYIEYIAEEVCKNIDNYLKLDTINRSSYCTKGHNGDISNDTSKPNAEVIIAKRLFGKQFEHLGKFVDYETPLKKSNENKGVGKIDLLAYDEENNNLTMIELKRADSEETLLRCILEIESYYRYANHQQLKKDFTKSTNTNLQKAILVFKGTEPLKPFDNKDEYPKLFELLNTLNIAVYELSEDAQGDFKIGEIV